MVPDRASAAAIILLVVAAALLANPLYLQEPDRGNQIIEVDHTSAAEATARRSAQAERVHQLPIEPRYAALQSIKNGSFEIDRSSPPLAVRLLKDRWRYIGSQRSDELYEPTVNETGNYSTIAFTAVDIEAVEQELDVTPPEGLEDAEGPRRVIWLSEQTVVFR